MMRFLHILGISAVVAACTVLIACVHEWRQDDPELWRLRDRLGVVEAFRQQKDHRAEASEQAASPLLAQAQVLADILNPPVAALARETESASAPGPLARTPSTSLRAGSLVLTKFHVVAVSCYPLRPERSMALIEPAIGGEAKWVKEGTSVGHFVVHEITQVDRGTPYGTKGCETLTGSDIGIRCKPWCGGRKRWWRAFGTVNPIKSDAKVKGEESQMTSSVCCPHI